MLINLNFKISEASRGNEVNTDETWDSDKIILEDLTINAVVTIKPGVTVYLGEDVDILVNGGIKAEGTEDNLINFTKYGENNWGYIIIKFGGIFEFCYIEGGMGICDYSEMGIYFRNNILESEGCGIGVVHSDIINNTIITKNGDALNYYNDPFLEWEYSHWNSVHEWIGNHFFTITNNIINPNNGRGIKIPKAYVFNNYVFDVLFNAIDTDGEIKNNIISNCNGSGIRSDGIIENNTIEKCGVGIIGYEIKMITNNKILNCDVGISVNAHDSTNSIIKNIINQNRKGISIHGNSIIKDNQINNNVIGIHISGVDSKFIDENSNKGVLIENNSISNNSEFGIYSEWSTSKIILNNISNNGDLVGPGNGGIFLDYHGNYPTLIENNKISYNKNFGIKSYANSRNIIKENSITHNGNYGILSNEYCQSKIYNNYIYYNNYGIFVEDRSFPLIKNNNISDNNQYGIYVINKSWPTIKENEIRNHKVGIYIDSTSNATILDNEFYGNEIDIIDKYHEKDENGNINPLLLIENQVLIIILLLIIIITSIFSYRKKTRKKLK
jgi:parallel beta-helix repeat protein